MLGRRDHRSRADARAFRPSIDGRLEPRLLLAARPAAIQTALGGQAVLLTTRSGQPFYVLVSTGTVRATRLSGGRFGLIVDGTNQDSSLTINPLVPSQEQGQAHTFNVKQARFRQLINIGSVRVSNGRIGSILGYRTAILSGPVFATADSRVDRIAFNTVTPGASINVGGDLNTLDVLNDMTLSGPNTGVFVGRDLNLLNVGGDLTIDDGATIFVGRDLGLAAQPGKGTGPSGQGASILGNFLLTDGGRFVVARALDAPFVVFGSTRGTMNLGITAVTPGGFFTSRGGSTPV